MRVGTDSDLLGALSAGGSNVLDIGTGTGVLSLMLAQRYPEARITAIEIDDGAILDASRNFAESRFASRIDLHHVSFQDYLSQATESHFDSIVCNPPYFHRSLECGSTSKTRARHTSSLPFPVLIQGAARLLLPSGRFSVCLPPEVLDLFIAHCHQAGLLPEHLYRIHTIPSKPPKRFVLICRKSTESNTHNGEYTNTTVDTAANDTIGTAVTASIPITTGTAANDATLPHIHNCCMLTPDRQRSPWYLSLMEPFLTYSAEPPERLRIKNQG